MIRPLSFLVLQAFLLRLTNTFCPRTSVVGSFSTRSTTADLPSHLYGHHRATEHHNPKVDDVNDNSDITAIGYRREWSPLSRRDALGKAATAMVAVATSTATGSSPAAAVTADPTRIELSVETDYLIKVMEYYDGDMRKVLGAIVRSPFTTVQIDPPSSNKNAAKDAILRALYSYEAPEFYVEQASWLQVKEKDKSLSAWLTRKRYKIVIPNLKRGMPAQIFFQEEGEQPLKTFVSLSNLEIAAAVAVLSYPATYAFYQYEAYREEQEAKAKKAAIAAKKAAAAKAKKKKAERGSKKEKKETPEKKKKPVAAKVKGAAKESAEGSKAPKGVRPQLETEESGGKRAQNEIDDAIRPKKAAASNPDSAATAVDQAPPTTLAATTPPKPKAPVAKRTTVASEVSVPETVLETPSVATPDSSIASVAAKPPLGSQPIENAGMDVYDAYLKQAYAASAAPLSSTPAPAVSNPPNMPVTAEQQQKTAVDAMAGERDDLSSETTRNQPETSTNNPNGNSSPPKRSSPFGNYLDSL